MSLPNETVHRAWGASDCVVSYDAEGNVVVRWKRGEGYKGNKREKRVQERVYNPRVEPQNNDERDVRISRRNECDPVAQERVYDPRVDHESSLLHGVWRVIDDQNRDHVVADDAQKIIAGAGQRPAEGMRSAGGPQPAGGNGAGRFGIFAQPEDIRTAVRAKLFAIPSIPRPRIFNAIGDRLRVLERHPDMRVRRAYETVRFATTFTAAFAVLFLALNFGSYIQIFRAALIPGADRDARVALQLMTNPVLREDLLRVPELPVAGSDTLSVTLPDIAPPDSRLIVPKIGKNVPLVQVPDAALRRRDWKTFQKDIQDGLKFGVVRYPGTAVPGQIGNVFLTGHSSYQPWDPGKYKDVFALLPSLSVGDEYSIFHDGALHRYRITEKFEVKPSDVSVLDQPQDALMSTLMTCVPVGTNLRRLILRAREVDAATGEMLAVADETVLTNTPDEWGGELVVW